MNWFLPGFKMVWLGVRLRNCLFETTRECSDKAWAAAVKVFPFLFTHTHASLHSLIHWVSLVCRLDLSVIRVEFIPTTAGRCWSPRCSRFWSDLFAEWTNQTTGNHWISCYFNWRKIGKTNRKIFSLLCKTENESGFIWILPRAHWNYAGTVQDRKMKRRYFFFFPKQIEESLHSRWLASQQH